MGAVLMAEKFGDGEMIVALNKFPIGEPMPQVVARQSFAVFSRETGDFFIAIEQGLLVLFPSLRRAWLCHSDAGIREAGQKR